jgi:benzoate-CoA ligase
MAVTFNAAGYFVDRNVLEGRGGHVAIECGDERVTYAQVLDRVNRVGAALRDRLRVGPEERVLLLLLDGPEFVYGFFGAMKIGAVPVPLNTLWKPADYLYVLTHSRARVAIVSDSLAPRIRALPAESRRYLRDLVVVGGADLGAGERSFADLLDGPAPDLQPELTTADDMAFWLYSSGSTGPPKACVHLHHDMVVCANTYAREVLGIAAADRTFSVAKLFFAYGLGNALYFPFSVGATTILWPGPPTAVDVYAVIEARRPTLLFSVPTNFAMLLAHTRSGTDFDLASVRLAVSAGEALPPAIFERFKQRFRLEILDGIGSTEILHIFISNRPGAIRPGSSGQLVSGYEARLLDDEQRPVARGTIGHLWIRGDSTCAGYFNEHEKTKDTIAGHWIRTGDQYRQDEGGFFWYAGRSDDMLKVGGIWVSPIEVEHVIADHASVLECAVVGREDRDGLVKPAACVVVKPGIAATPDLATDIQTLTRERLADYKRPRWVEFVEELPKTATGKVQRYKLRG